MIWVALSTMEKLAAVGCRVTTSGAGQIGADDGHCGAAGRRAAGRGDRTYRRRCDIGIAIGDGGGAGAGRGGHRDLDACRRCRLRTVAANLEVALSTEKPVAATVPNFTAVTPVRLLPVIVTELPPDVVPLAGLTRADDQGPKV